MATTACHIYPKGEIIRYAGESINLTDGMGAGREAVKWFAQKTAELDKQLDKAEEELYKKCMAIPYAKDILEIPSIGQNILSGIISEMGDIERFNEAEEIQKLSGMALVANSSRKHKGKMRIGYRKRKKLRYWLFQAAKSVVSHSEEFKELHTGCITRPDNPLQKMQSLMAIACKILRIIYTILKKESSMIPKNDGGYQKRKCTSDICGIRPEPVYEKIQDLAGHLYRYGSRAGFWKKQPGNKR